MTVSNRTGSILNVFGENNAQHRKVRIFAIFHIEFHNVSLFIYLIIKVTLNTSTH